MSRQLRNRCQGCGEIYYHPRRMLILICPICGEVESRDERSLEVGP